MVKAENMPSNAILTPPLAIYGRRISRAKTYFNLQELTGRGRILGLTVVSSGELWWTVAVEDDIRCLWVSTGTV